MDGIVALNKSKKYTEESLIGLGALRGANCTIKSYLDNLDGTHTIIFEWTGTDNTKQTNTMIVKDGNDGVSISSVVIDGDNHLICTMSDGSIQDAGLIADIGGSGADSVLEEDVRVTGTSLGAIEDGIVINKDTTFTQFVKMACTKRIAPIYTQPIVNLSLSPTSVQEINSTVDIVITPTFTKNDAGNLSSYTIYRDGVGIYTGSTIEPYTDSVTLDGNKVYKVSCQYLEGIIKNDNLGTPYPQGHVSAGTKESANKTITAVYASYYGAVDTLTPTESEIVALTKDLRTAKGKTVDGINMSNKRFCFCYPTSFGDLASILDGNGFQYLSAYTKSTITINGVNYNLYVMTNATTVTNFKQIFA